MSYLEETQGHNFIYLLEEGVYSHKSLSEYLYCPVGPFLLILWKTAELKFSLIVPATVMLSLSAFFGELLFLTI